MHGSTVQTRKNKSFLKNRQFRCFVFIAAIKENRVSKRYDAANGVNIFKASVTTSGYPFLQDNQNLSNCSNENSNCMGLSADNSTSCGF
jgi:hypothetical protein